MTFSALAARPVFPTLVLNATVANKTVTPADFKGYRIGGVFRVVIAAGVYVYSTSTASAGLIFSGFNSADKVYLVNRGFIMGRGGDGGGLSSNGNSGGNALSLSCATEIENNLGYIAGGGGGGAGYFSGGGGGAGGGNGGDGFTAGGVGGAVGVAGANAAAPSGSSSAGGGGGGRVLPSATFANGPLLVSFNASLAGFGGEEGGTGACRINAAVLGTAGGGGGGWGMAGGRAEQSNSCTTAYGGYGNSVLINNPNQNGRTDPDRTVVYNGGAAGKAVALNGFSITWVFGSSRVYGAVS